MGTISVSSQITALVVSAIGASGKPTGLTVDRFRERVYGEEQLPGASVYAASESSEWVDMDNDPDTDALDCKLQLAIVLRTLGEPVDVVLDPIFVWVDRQMMADPTWGGLAQYTKRTNRQWEGANKESEYGKMVVLYDIGYYTLTADPTEVSE